MKLSERATLELELDTYCEMLADIARAKVDAKRKQDLAMLEGLTRTEGRVVAMIDKVQKRLDGTAMETHPSSDGCEIEGPPGPECGCQSCRSEVVQ